MADGLKVQNVVMYGFVGGLLVLVAVMLATTPVPEWMDGSGDEGPQIGGPLTHLQEKRMPWTFENGKGPPTEEDEQEENPYDDPEVQGYGSKTLATEERGRYDMHTTGREYQTGQLAQKRGSRQLSARSALYKNPLTSKQLRAITHARHKSKAFYTQGDQSVRV